MHLKPLSRSFYEPPADVVAPQLLGHWLIRKTPKNWCGGVIVETEAYLVGDPSCHAYLRETARNRAMWGSPGHAYVYLIYGAYHCFNAVCRPAGVAEAVLVRAVHPKFGLDWMRANRPVAQERDLTNGPGKFCAAMDIDRTLDQADLCDSTSPLFIARHPEPDTFRASAGPIVVTTRIGISRAADWPLRYFLANDPFVSRRVLKGHQRHQAATAQEATEYSRRSVER